MRGSSKSLPPGGSARALSTFLSCSKMAVLAAAGNPAHGQVAWQTVSVWVRVPALHLGSWHWACEGPESLATHQHLTGWG